jgi:molybdopterin synthase catalytic subunit
MIERIVHQAIDLPALLAGVSHPGAGAVLSFSGTVRESHLGRRVVAIEYHGYEPMAARELARIEAQLAARWPGVRALIVHRLGRLELGDVTVVVAVTAPHRAEAFEALRHGIDTLKEQVPIWKKEIYTDGEAWLEGS